MKAITSGKDIVIRASQPRGGNPFGAYFSKVDPLSIPSKNLVDKLAISKNKTKWIFKIEIDDSIQILHKMGRSKVPHDKIIYTLEDLVVPKSSVQIIKNPNYKGK